MAHPHIIALTGFAGTGKDAVGAILVRDFGFVRVAFADALKIEAFDGVTIGETEYRWTGRKDQQGRRVLQNLGEARRKECPTYWIRKVLAEMDRHDGESI